SVARQRFEQVHRSLGQRHAVCLAALHALGWNSPYLPADFRPTCPDGFADPGGRQDCEFERAGVYALFLAQLDQEARQVVVGHGRIVLDHAHLRALPQQMTELPLPSSPVLTGAITARLCPIEDALDAPTHAARCLRLRRPDRVQHLAHEGGVDLRNRQLADDREREASERTLPLLDGFAVAPPAAVILDVAIGTLPERHHLGSIQPRLRTSGTPSFNRV